MSISVAIPHPKLGGNKLFTIWAALWKRLSGWFYQSSIDQPSYVETPFKPTAGDRKCPQLFALLKRKHIKRHSGVKDVLSTFDTCLRPRQVGFVTAQLPRCSSFPTKELDMPRLHIEREYEKDKASSSSGQTQAGQPTNDPSLSDRIITQLIRSVASDPGLVSHEPSPRLLQRLCGRWIVARQLQLGLSNDMIQSRTGINAETLMQLELGLSTNTHIDGHMRDQLSSLLAGKEDTTGWIRTVIDAALGEIHQVNDEILAYMRESNPLIKLVEENDKLNKSG